MNFIGNAVQQQLSPQVSLADLQKQIAALTQGGGYGFGQMSSDPFASAMSGNQQGTLQPFINRQTNNAYNALNSGLLGYSPQAMQAGNASGTPITANDPKASQFNLQGLLSNFEGFGNRSWMDK